MAIFSNPLEQYFESTSKREIPDFAGCGSTACWRGYKAIWELKESTLYLRRITGCHSNCGIETSDGDLVKMFGSDNVVASWFTGEIMVPKGELIQYFHMGYASIYEEEHIYNFKSGKLKNVRVKSNKKYAKKKRRLSEEQEITKSVQDTLFYYAKTQINWDTLTTPWYMFPDDKYLLTYNRKGNLKKVWVDYEGAEGSRDKLDNWWWNISDDRESRKKIKKALKPLNLSYISLPKRKFEVEFEIIYWRKTGILELFEPM